MNQRRRVNISIIVNNLDSLHDELAGVINDEEEYRDNIPDNLEGSETYLKSDEAIDQMSEANDLIEECTGLLNELI